MKTFELWFTLTAFGCSRFIDSVKARNKRDARKLFKKNYSIYNSEAEVFTIIETTTAP